MGQQSEDDQQEAARKAQRSQRFDTEPATSPPTFIRHAVGRGRGLAKVGGAGVGNGKAERAEAPLWTPQPSEADEEGMGMGTPPASPPHDSFSAFDLPPLQEGDGVADEAGDGEMLCVGIVATCEDMCPSEERVRRATNAELNHFERVDPEDARHTSPELCIKKAVRNYDFDKEEGIKPQDFRTINALAKTMRHLRTLMDRCALLCVLGRGGGGALI